MKQVIQRLRDGQVEVIDVPAPDFSAHEVLIALRASVLSAGTERAKVETGKKNLIGKARARPDQVNKVITKAKADGLRATVDAVRMQLDSPSPLGYSAAGTVVAVGSRVRSLSSGDRVACGGAERATHAELVAVPGNLCVKLPPAVGFDDGAFATLGSVALHGVRQAGVRLGERVAVIGLGLVGQLAGMLLRAAGVTAVGIDLDARSCALAREIGAVDWAFARADLDRAVPSEAADCDAVIITAATRSSDPLALAARLGRDRARVVVVGDVGLTIQRAPYYEKELDIRFSRSYGPGRYDNEYEERGLDYPVGYVRWTEQRNMQAVVELIANGRIDVQPLIAHRFAINDAADAFETLMRADGTPLGIVLEYGSHQPAKINGSPAGVAPLGGGRPAPSSPRHDPMSAGFIGSGSFARRVLIPAAEEAGFRLTAVASARGLSAAAVASSRAGARAATPDELLDEESIGTVFVATRHASHAGFAERALLSGRAVFVEKPPAITADELTRLRHAREGAAGPLAVGFNRRYAPVWSHVEQHLGAEGPRQVVIRVNAGVLPPDHWLNDPEDGGGRLLGEGCHFVDLACWLIGALPDRVTCSTGNTRDVPNATSGCFSITLSFASGSLATITYLDGGAPRLEKELIEVHANGRSAVVHDFRTIDLHGQGRTRHVKLRGHDKGHRAQMRAFIAAMRGEAAVIVDPLDTMAVTLAALTSLTSDNSLSADTSPLHMLAASGAQLRC